MGTHDTTGLTVDVGDRVFDSEGAELGTVRGITEHGFTVSTAEGIESLSIAHERSAPETGEAELMWRCDDCGEMGDIADLPGSCPNCGAVREWIYYYVDD
jgi:rubrerythrin